MKKTKDIMMYGISVLIVLGFFADIYLLSIKAVPPENEKVLYTLIGVLATSFANVIHWFIGSSSGSKDKTELLGQKKTE